MNAICLHQCDYERQRIINDAARMLANIRQMFLDIQHWNDNTRPKLFPDDLPIELDPDGRMGKIAEGMVVLLQREATLGNFPQPYQV